MSQEMSKVHWAPIAKWLAMTVGQPTQTSLGATVVLLGLLISRFVI